MKNTKKLFALLLAVVMCLSIFVGCHRNRSEEKVSISYWLGGNIDTLEPGMSLDSVPKAILFNTYELLLYIDDMGNKVFKGAKSCDISDDGKVYTLHLREDAKWSDGKPVLAADFEYGWKRLADPAHICGNSYPFTLLKNGMDVISGKVPASKLGVTAADDYTLRVELESPCTYFLNELSNSAFYPQRKDICESDDAWFRDVSKVGISTGPFMVSAWTLNSELVLSKNPYFHDADKVKIDEIVIPLVAEQITAFTAFEADQLDGMLYTPEINRMLVESPDEVIIRPGVATKLIKFNTTKPPFDDVRVRKAFTLALDRPEFLTVVGDVKKAVPIGSIIPPGIYYNGEELHKAGETIFGISPSKANLEEAKALMAEAGYPNGENFPETAIVLDAGVTSQHYCEVLASMWHELGVSIELHPFEYKIYLDMMAAGDYQVAPCVHYGIAALEPYNYLECWLPGQGVNSTGFNPPEFAEAFRKASSDPNPAIQREQILKAEEIFMSGYAVCPLCCRSATFTQKVFLKNILYLGENPLFENAYADKAK